MESSRIWLSALGFCALTIACGDSGARHAIQVARVEPVTEAVTSDVIAPPEPLAVGAAAAAEATSSTPAPNAAPARTGAIPVLNQMLTTQALLVSLLLMPFSQELPGVPRVPAGAR